MMGDTGQSHPLQGQGAGTHRAVLMPGQGQTPASISFRGQHDGRVIAGRKLV